MSNAVPLGEGYRGTEGRIGFLLVQADQAFSTAMEAVLRPFGLSRSQFGVLSVVVRQPGLSSADLARAVMLTPQAANLIVAALEHQGLIERRPHATHGRILEIHPTDVGRRRVEQAYPAVAELEDRMTEGMSDRQVLAVKRWLVSTSMRMSSTTRPHAT